MIADSKGRKPVMIITTLSGAVFMLMFGFSVNYPMAIVTRILYGFTNGEFPCKKLKLASSLGLHLLPISCIIPGDEARRNLRHACVSPCLFLYKGMISTCKAMVSESSDDSNQPLGVAVIGVAWGAGYIVGPAISGAIADPIGQYNLNITSEFEVK